MSSANPSFLTPTEYLELERKAEVKSEYINGRMYAMVGATLPHGFIVTNLIREISTQLLGKNCRVVPIDVRVKVSPTGMYTYPDVVAFCGEPELEDKHRDTLLNPALIAEVLSPSTEAYDRGEKFAHYRRIDTLQEYVLVAQDKMRVEHYRREGDQWILTELNTPHAILRLRSIDCQIELSAVYRDVDLLT
ncbi:MAG TPA: Uma2 family endonuclease [Thermoanaerobaculia bacterium]|nr:Uma2 family endonuclease [Thermoanaerobaculia bacterium]